MRGHPTVRLVEAWSQVSCSSVSRWPN